MEEKYFIISNSDGDTTITEMSKEELLIAIEEQYWGDKTPMSLQDYHEAGSRDTNYWGECLMIIKGSVVVPTPKQVVTKFDID